MNYLLFFHAALGGLALLAGTLALLFKKGGQLHRLSGRVFFYSMLFSAIAALIISGLPIRGNPFLFTIGLFSTYFILSGYSAIRYKKAGVNLFWDKLLASLMLLTGISMILLPLLMRYKLNIVMSVFGVLALFMAIQDFRLFNKPEKLKSNYVQTHLSKMMAGYIAAFTAFLVVNNVLPSLVSWLAPTVIGTAVIIFWTRKYPKTQ